MRNNDEHVFMSPISIQNLQEIHNGISACARVLSASCQARDSQTGESINRCTEGGILDAIVQLSGTAHALINDAESKMMS